MPSITRTSGFHERDESLPTPAAKSPSKVRTLDDLMAQEIADIGTQGARKARRDAFEAGRPVTIEKDGRVMREWPDGRLEDLGPSNE